jgi:hypothetical protein
MGHFTDSTYGFHAFFRKNYIRYFWSRRGGLLPSHIIFVYSSCRHLKELNFSVKALRSEDLLSWSRNSSHFMEPAVHQRVYKNPSLVTFLNHITPLHDFLSHFFIIHYNITIPSTVRTPKYSISLEFSN